MYFMQGMGNMKLIEMRYVVVLLLGLTALFLNLFALVHISDTTKIIMTLFVIWGDFGLNRRGT